MPKFAVIIPSRKERFLTPTVHDLFKKAEGEIEVLVVLEEKWPTDWDEVTKLYPRLHTIYHPQAKGMRPALNAAAALAQSHGAKYLFKLDAHCMVDEGFDTKLMADCEPNWVVVPRRYRLDPINWSFADEKKPPIDYHYLSYPDNPQDFGGPGLNGKVWIERQKERVGKPEYDIDEEMSSQGSGWFMHAKYYDKLELLDDKSYGTFWNEFQEIGLKCWLSGGQVMINKKTWYAHLHKGKTYGRGYRLEESLLQKGRSHTNKWLHNSAWAKQSLPFKTLIERFWPVPTWPDNWEELVYGASKSTVAVGAIGDNDIPVSDTDSAAQTAGVLTIHLANYGVSGTKGDWFDVTEHLQSLVIDGVLDIQVTNDSMNVGNVFRGKKKTLVLDYSLNGGPQVSIERKERDFVIIGKGEYEADGLSVQQSPVGVQQVLHDDKVFDITRGPAEVTDLYIDDKRVDVNQRVMQIPAADLNIALIKRFGVSPHRLRAPMPIEIPYFHRNDLARLFAELGFSRGAEIGVAEGNYSEVLLKANPTLALTLVDPWTRYADNPRAHSEQHQEYSLNETKRKVAPYPNVTIAQGYSMDRVREIPEGSLDFVYIDGHHSFDYVMQDLIEWSKRVRSGGIVSGDDYYAMRWGGVVEAVQAYTQAHEIIPWFIFTGHKSVDFMWVKP